MEETREKLRIRNKRILCLLAATIFFSSAGTHITWANEVPEEIVAEQQETATIVTNQNEFLLALKQGKSRIVVRGSFSVDNGNESDGAMKPVEVSGGTTIEGEAGASIAFRCPLQITGDDVVLRNLECLFESSTALGSIAQREIFLGGHSLILDGVETYLKGAGGSLGGFGSSEDELLPSIYAGSYAGIAVGDQASLTVTNATAKTCFEAIYMGHDACGTKKYVPYTAGATLKLDAATSVRNIVSADLNREAQISVTGEKKCAITKITGNQNTSLQLEKSTMTDVMLQNIGTVALEDGAHLGVESGTLCDVSVKNGAILDYSNCKDQAVQISGNFSGGSYEESSQTDERGKLILPQNGTISIAGTVSGTTTFLVGASGITSSIYEQRAYIAAQKHGNADFVLPASAVQNGYELYYNNGAWTIKRDLTYPADIGSIQVVSAPTAINLTKITGKTDDTVYCTLKWFDPDGAEISVEDVEYYGYYGETYVIPILTEYLTSEDASVLEKTGWREWLLLEPSENQDDRYYFRAIGNVKPGTYTFLLFAEEPFADEEEDSITVGQVKAAASLAKAKFEVKLSETDEVTPDPNPTPTPPTTPDPDPNPTPTPPTTPDPDPNPTPTPPTTPDPTPTPPPVTPDPTPNPTPTPPPVTPDPTPSPTPGDTEQHVHQYQSEVTKAATTEQQGVITYRCNCGETYTEMIASPKEVRLSKDSYVYNGKVQKPDTIVVDSTGSQIGAQYYTISFRNNKNAGIATVTVRFSGNYAGSMEQNFTIAPKGTTLSKVSAAKKGFTVKWKKQAAQTSGYEIQYATKAKFSKKDTKSVVINKNKTTGKKVAKLKGGKKYYVRIRTYKNAKIQGKTVKVYSAWSKTKTVKTKK